jgi:hypothetical protein
MSPLPSRGTPVSPNHQKKKKVPKKKKRWEERASRHRASVLRGIGRGLLVSSGEP